MELLNQSKQSVKRIHYQFQLDDGIIINYVRLESKEEGEEDSISITNKNWHPLDQSQDLNIIDSIKAKVEQIESK